MESLRRDVSKNPPQTISRRSSHLDAEEFSSTIPIELTIEIFSRLPLKSIARCRCVSKRWASILRRQDFTDSFFTKSSARPKLLFASHKGSEFRFFSSPQPRENASVITADHHVSFPVERVHHISEPINGFFCITYDPIFKESVTATTECVLVICNPSTRQSFTLPKVKTTTKETKLISFLGYDPIEKQHKVLSMTDQNDRGGVEHQVLTLGNGNLTWRLAECGVPHSFPWGGECVCINGVLYYAAEASNGCDYKIGCFDVGSEKYRFVKCADTEKLINFEGKLASVSYTRSSFLDNTASLEMWILEDAGKHEWSKRVFDLPPTWIDSVAEEFIRFVGVTATNEFVFLSFLPIRPFPCVLLQFRQGRYNMG